MEEVIFSMLAKYKCTTQRDYENALKEILQEVALLGLWRAKFFEHALFYGGSALRILYGLDRFSEDLDFSLLKKDSKIKLSSFLNALETELRSFGFQITVESKTKGIETAIESAFIKAGTSQLLLTVNVPVEILKRIHSTQNIKIKIEVDTDPPGGFETEVKNLLAPIPFQVKTMKLLDLFAGKIHAIIARGWKTRVKGRDFYDFVWYLSQNTPCRLDHLRQRLVNSGHLTEQDIFTQKEARLILLERIKNTDIREAVKDVEPFLKNNNALTLWNQDFFKDCVEKIIWS